MRQAQHLPPSPPPCRPVGIDAPLNRARTRMYRPTGPLYRMWSYQWLPQRASPIFSSFNSSDVVICPSDSLVTRSYPECGGREAGRREEGRGTGSKMASCLQNSLGTLPADPPP